MEHEKDIEILRKKIKFFSQVLFFANTLKLVVEKRIADKEPQKQSGAFSKIKQWLDKKSHSVPHKQFEVETIGGICEKLKESYTGEFYLSTLEMEDLEELEKIAKNLRDGKDVSLEDIKGYIQKFDTYKISNEMNLKAITQKSAGSSSVTSSTVLMSLNQNVGFTNAVDCEDQQTIMQPLSSMGQYRPLTPTCSPTSSTAFQSPTSTNSTNQPNSGIPPTSQLTQQGRWVYWDLYLNGIPLVNIVEAAKENTRQCSEKRKNRCHIK